jgi:hypothetical protein
MDQVTTLPSAAPDAPAIPAIRPIPLRELAPWLVFASVLLVLAVYFVGVEQGALSVFSNHYVHEFVHDGRHLLGFPCH